MNELIEFLIKDEEEAILSYSKAILKVQLSDLPNKTEMLKDLLHIKQEEKEHKAILEEMLKNL